MLDAVTTVGVVVIGRNEGQRLVRCLQSLSGKGFAVVYVDSGSTDDSVKEATALGVNAIALDMKIPFTAARARNAGFQHIQKISPNLKYVQFVDGDCEVMPEWMDQGVAFLEMHQEVAVVSGHCRERYPEKSIYNLMCDLEWNTPIGEAKASGGNALMRVKAFQDAGGFRNQLIAGEEPEPVSYTHLDVYKRQIYNRAMKSSCLLTLLSLQQMLLCCVGACRCLWT